MRVVIVSDLHGNVEALDVLPGDYDYLLCAGDLVDYGPDPEACVRFVREKADVAVRGNHDQAVAYQVDCGCSYAMKKLSLLTRGVARERLSESEIQYLKQRPLEAEFSKSESAFYITHAAPGDLYRYLEEGISDQELHGLIESIPAQVIVWGHTHKPWVRKLGAKLIINPGSLGQPRDGIAAASYAVWEDGEAQIVRQTYQMGVTFDKLLNLPLETEVKLRLCDILKTGGGSIYKSDDK